MSKIFSQWQNSGEYKSVISNALTNIIHKSELSANESETSFAFETELYYLFRSNFDTEIVFRKEKRVNGIIHEFEGLKERQSGRGRLDAVVNKLIIEYKHHSKLETSNDKLKAKNQVVDYLKALKKEHNIQYDAILTDGIKIQYFQFIDEEVRCSTLRALTTYDIDKIICSILNNNTKKFYPLNLEQDFKISMNSESDSKRIAKILFKKLCNNATDKSEMLFSEWQVLMHLSVNDNGKSRDIENRRKDLSKIFDTQISNPLIEYKALFALHTTYAIIVKLIACKVVDVLNYNSEANVYHDLLGLSYSKLQKFFANMEDGYSYRNMNILNFLEGDYFSWYSDEDQWDETFFNEIVKIIRAIDDYSSFSIDVSYMPIDIFKDLYMSIIPQSIRHSMGEYFTPEWLADGVVSRALEYVSNNEWKGIDPCCGSGIFVLSMIKKIVGDVVISDLSPESRKELLNKILTRVYGIDINPLAVLSARVSYYLAIHQLGDVRDVEIPIYLGDSAIIPIQEKIDNINCYTYVVDNTKTKNFRVTLPARLVKKREFGLIMNSLQSLVKAEDPTLLYNVLVGRLNTEEKHSPILLSKIRDLSDNLVSLHKNHWDGIWIRIATNFMLIARLDSFDMIVGNPPWVKWEHLPTAYTLKIKDFCDIRHIFCNDGGMYGGAQLNICALISNVTASNWLLKSGILAFLMPDSIMSQNSYEEFRNFYISNDRSKRLYLQGLDRWMAPLRPFKVGKKVVGQDFNTYYYGEKKVDYRKGVTVREITKKKRKNDGALNNCHNWIDAEQYLATSSSLAIQLAEGSTAFTYNSQNYNFSDIIGRTDYKYRTGVESTPFEVFKLLGTGPSKKKNHYRFKNDVRKTARYKVDDIPADGWDFPVTYIYPMVEGPKITPFSYTCNSFHIIPYSPNAPTKPVSIESLYASDKELAEYFLNHRDLLDSQSEKSKVMHCGKDFFALSKIGSYTFAPYMVAARDNSRFCASVINKTRTPWGEIKQSICVKHTIIISQDVDGNNITEDEAHYINGILNSNIVVDYIHKTFKTNGFSLNKSNLFIPKYDSKSSLFTSIASLSKEATLDNSKIIKNAELLSEAYILLCKTLNKRGQQMTDSISN